MRPLTRLRREDSEPTTDAETRGNTEAESSKRPESGYPACAAPLRTDRILGAIARMAAEYARKGNLDAARQAADEALAGFGDATDASAIARASVDLGEALVILGDPTCREILEDAGTLFEDLGDDEGIARVDQLLRAAQATIEESPRSFQARRRP